MSKQCTNCGTVLEDDALFCSECGTKQGPLQKKCPNCGADIKEGAKFCMSCGAPVNAASPAKPATPPQKQASADFEVSQPDANTLSFNIMGIPFNMKFIRGGMIGQTELSDFYIGETVVTQAFWQTVMGENPSKDNSDIQYPVTNITKQLANNFLTRLKKITGVEFNIPSSSQLKYVAFKGCENWKKEELKETAWCDHKIHPVGGMMPNLLGLYDLCDWHQLVIDNLPKGDYYRFNPSTEGSDGIAGHQTNLEVVDFINLKLVDFVASLIPSNFTLTLRLVINIPVAPEIENAKKKQEEKAREEYEESLLRFEIRRKKKYGFMDKDGREVIPCKYDFVEGFKEGLAKVRLNKKYGFIDISGKEVIPCKFDEAGEFCEGLAWVRLDDDYSYINKKGKVVIKLEDDEETPTNFSEGLTTAMVDDELCFINQKGKVVIDCDDYEQVYCFNEGMARVIDDDDEWGFIDKKGKLIVHCIYDDAEDFSEGLAVVKDGGKYGYVDNTGKLVIPCRYDYAWSFHEGFAIVKVNGKHGYIDKDGNTVIPCKYDDAQYFYEGLAAVEIKDRIGFIDRTGQLVVPSTYDFDDILESPGFHEGLAKVQMKDKWGYVDKSGSLVIPCKYDAAWHFKNGLARVDIKDTFGYVDKTGRELGFE